MEKYIGVILMCIISGILAALVHMLVLNSKKISLKNICFYGAAFYGVISVMKILVGEGEKTLFSAFSDIERATYLHYGIPLAVLAVIFPIALKLILKKKQESFINMFLSVFSGIIGIEFLLIEEISSYNYTAVCIIALLSAVLSVFVRVLEIQFANIKTKEKITFILPIMLLWTVIVFIFEPNQLMLNNLDEFSIPYFEFFFIMLAEGIALTAVYTFIGVFLLSDGQLKLFGALIFAISAAGYIQGNFLNGEMLLMDGNAQTWSSAQKAGNLIVWIAIIAVSVFAVYNKRYKSICKKLIPIVCIYISLMQVMALGFLIINTEFPAEENEFVLTTNHMLELDKENNVVVFVLDWFDRQIMDDIENDNPEFTKSLKDFTEYTNTTSKYAYTALSVPYLLTGVEWEYGMENTQYCEYAYDNSSLLDDIEDRNYSLGIYTGSNYVGSAVKQRLINYSDKTSKKLGFMKAFSVMNRTSKYKMAPFAFKHNYFYITDDIEEIVVNSGEYSINNDIIFYNELSKNRLSFAGDSDYDGAFRFYHLKGAHPLFTMDENFEEVKENGTQLSQSKGSLKIVFRYIEEMKKLGVYDNATIIITADHGQNTNVMKKSTLDTDYDMTSTPILFVKLPGEQHADGPLKSKAPVSHTDFAATLINAVGADASEYGRTFAQIQENEIRKREFTYVVAPDKKYKKYVIKGDSNNPESWQE